MSEAPRKPAKKKAAVKKKAAPRTDAPADAQEKKMDAPREAPKEAPQEPPKTDTRRNDQQMREAVLEAALPHAAFDGFTPAVMEKACLETGCVKGDLARLFENGPVSLIEFYSTLVDAQMETRLAAMDLKAMKIRARIATAVKTRLAILKPHREAARRAAALLSLPMNVSLGAKLTYRTVDAMWRAAGDTSTDFSFYTKRGILAGVYGATVMHWFNDTSDDEAATDEFLAARIENVMQFEKFKGQAKSILANLPIFSGLGGRKA